MKEQELALRIREQRIKKGMTQKQLAETLHISDKAISKWENGKCLPDRSMMNEISAVLDIPIEELYQIKQTVTWYQRFTKEKFYIKKSEEFKLTVLCFLCSVMLSVVLYCLHFFGEPANNILYMVMLRDFLSSFLLDAALMISIMGIGLCMGYRYSKEHDELHMVSRNIGRALMSFIAILLSIIEFYLIKTVQSPELAAFVAMFLMLVILYQGTLELLYKKGKEVI